MPLNYLQSVGLLHKRNEKRAGFKVLNPLNTTEGKYVLKVHYVVLGEEV